MENPYKYKGEPIPRIDSRMLIEPTTRGILYTWDLHHFRHSVEVYFAVYSSRLVYQLRTDGKPRGFGSYCFNGDAYGKYFGDG